MEEMQEITHESLKYPGRNCDKMMAAYDSFLDSVKQFSDLSALPTKIHFQSKVSAADFATHNAS